MPADQLTRAEPLAAAVLETLASLSSVDGIAHHHGIDPALLTDAVETFTTAGLAALSAADTARWSQVNITAATREHHEHIARELDRLGSTGGHQGWWFLNKPPGWRVRLIHADRAAAAVALERLRASGVIDRWTWSIYEPETTAFGGGPGMACVHDLFCADTTGVLAHLASGSALGRKEVSLVLLSELTRGARLDTFETADVFAKVAGLRPPVAPNKAVHVRRLAAVMRPHLAGHLNLDELAARAGGHMTTWAASFGHAGSLLTELAATGRLSRGLRSVLAQTVIFHWNRLGLSAAEQSALAGSAVHALLPGDQP